MLDLLAQAVYDEIWMQLLRLSGMDTAHANGFYGGKNEIRRLWIVCRRYGKDDPFFRDVLGFEIREEEDTSNVYLIKDGTLFLLYGRNDFEKMTNRKYEYIKGLNGHFEIALYVDTFEEVDAVFSMAVKSGAAPVLEPELEPWGQRTCYIADPEGNLIEIGSWNRPYNEKDL